MGVCHRHRSGLGTHGLKRGNHPLYLGQEERAEMAARLAAEGVSALADNGRAARVADDQVSADRLSIDNLLLGAQEKTVEFERGRSGVAEDVRQAGNSACRAGI